MQLKIEYSSLKISRIKANETYAVRHPVLRKGRPIEDCAFDNDNLNSTFHFGLFYKETLIGVATFLKNNCALIANSFQYQLRGMAILHEYQGQKLGKVLLKYGESFLKEKNIEIIWCNAREIAYSFYLKQGYKVIGEPFIIAKIGKHFTMYKYVTSN